MKKIALIALAAVSLGAMAAPAAAPGYDRNDRYDSRYDDSRQDNSRWNYRHDWDRGFNINQMQGRLEHRIDRGIRNGRLTRHEANVMRDQFVGIARLEARYRQNGLSRYERNDLERRLVAFEHMLDKNLRDNQYAYRR